MWGWIGTLFRGVHTVGLGMESGNDWMKYSAGDPNRNHHLGGLPVGSLGRCGTARCQTGTGLRQKIGAAEVGIQRADGAAFTVRFMETVMATVVNPAHPLAAVFTTDEQPDSPWWCHLSRWLPVPLYPERSHR